MTAVSYSRWQTYDQCPARFKYAHLDRLPEEKGPALLRGSFVHSEAEAYLNRAVRQLPASLKEFAVDFKRLRQRKAQAEVQVAVSKDWTPTDWNDGDVWLRAVFDALLIRKRIAWIIDFKTGKRREVHQKQLELYGALGFALYPVDIISAELWYLDTGVVQPVEFTREADAQRLQDLWVERLAPMGADEIFAPSPGPLCAWCSFSTRKGGPCKF